MKGRVGLMALFVSTLSVLASPSAGVASGGGGGVVIYSERIFPSFRIINRSLLLGMLNPTYFTSDVTHGQERLPSIWKKPPVWRWKLSSTVSTREHGDAYIEEIQPLFDNFKARHFDSSWDWSAYYHLRSRNHCAFHCPH
jgi:hypothetical protein